MKIILVSFFFSIGMAYTQNVFDDAVYFKSMGSFSGNDFSISLTEEGKSRISYYAENQSEISGIPLFKGKITFTGEEQSFQPWGSFTPKSLGGMDVTNLAVGLSDFLIERAKTELNTAFFKQLKNELNTSELKVLFQNTVNILNVIDTDIYQYSLYLNNLKIAFEQDIQALPYTLKKIAGKKILPDIVLLLDFFTQFIAGKHIAELIRNLQQDDKNLKDVEFALDFLAQLKTNQHPAQLIRFLSNSNTLKMIDQDLNQKLKAVEFISESFRNTNGERYWVSREELAQLNDSITLRIYLGLLYQKMQKDEYSSIKGVLGKWVDSNDVTLEKGFKLKKYIYELSELTDLLELSVSDYKKKRKEIIVNPELSQKEKYARMYEESMKVYDQTLNIIEMTYKSEGSPFYVRNQNKPDSLIQKLREVGQIGVFISNKQYLSAISAVVVLLNINNFDNVTVKKIMKYGTFMAALIEAETPDEAKAAIEAVALPPGSYSIKRYSRFNVSLNGYIGGFYGHEFINGVSDGLAFNNLSLSAPVGVYFGWGLCGSKAKNPWSFGFFIPVIDLGTVASFRLGNSDAATIPSIKLNSLIAPGLFLEFGIGATPLSFGIGTQIGPKLRNIDETTADVGDFYWRVGASLKVDIPILNLYSSPKFSKKEKSEK